MKKLCLGCVAAAILLGLFLFFAFANSDKFINDYSHRAVNFIISQKTIKGITIEQLSFGQANLNSLDTIIWHDISSAINIPAQNEFFSGKDLLVHADVITLKIESFFAHKIRLSATGLTVRSVVDQNYSHNKTAQQFDSLTDGKASFVFNLNFFNKDKAVAQLQDIFHELHSILDSGRSKYPLTLTGVSSFVIRDENVKSLLTVEQEGSEYVLVLNKESLEIISWLFDEKLTEPEVELLARNPFRAPRLLRIKDEAENVAKEAYRQNNIVPEDAYRHILWSYLLTKKYGPAFSEKITDAHEQGVTDNSESEHQMDFANNQIGRQYALNKYRKEEILERIFRDNKVVRQAE